MNNKILEKKTHKPVRLSYARAHTHTQEGLLKPIFFTLIIFGASFSEFSPSKDDGHQSKNGPSLVCFTPMNILELAFSVICS